MFSFPLSSLSSRRFNGSLRRGILHDDHDDDGNDDKNDGGGSVWLFKHFHHKFAREATRIPLAPCSAFSLARPAYPPFVSPFYCLTLRAYLSSRDSRDSRDKN
jgi:hypothetical protein